MKILFIDENKVVNYAGGIEKVLCDFANEFTKRGHKVFLLCMDAESGKPFFRLDEKVRFINLARRTEYYGEFFDYHWTLKKLQREVSKLWSKEHDCKQSYFFRGFIQRLDINLQKIQPNVVISIGPDSAILAQKCPHIKGIPVISMCHIVPKIEHFSEKHIVAWQKCRMVQVLQPSFVSQMQSLGITKLRVIPNCVKQEEDSSIQNARESVEKRLLLIARIEPVRKRQHLALQAFAQLAKKYPDWKLEMYGSVGNKKYYKSLQKMIVEKHLNRQVSIKEPVKDLQQLYQQSEILLSTSDFESFGLSVVEAMSAGLPVIAFRDCYPDDYIVVDGKTGLLSDSSVESFVRCMDRLMGNVSLRKTYGKNAHEYAKRFAPDKIWKQWNDLLQECVEEKV